jgi:diguanylate cyclase
VKQKDWFGAARTWVLGSEPSQRQRASQCLLVLMVYLAFAVVQHTEVMLGLILEQDSWRLTAWNLAGGVGFFALIRSGLNERIAQGRRRALAVPQSLWAMVGIAWSYGITGPARGAVILIMLVVLIFGVFTLTVAESRGLLALGFGMLAVVMGFKALTDPLHYEPRVEAMHLLFAGIVMLAVSSLSIRIGKLRLRLERRGEELSAALERIQALATRDELTGLANRRAAVEHMQHALAIRPVPGAPETPAMSVALVDIDHFKRVNDERGHAAGDEVLRRTAACGQSVMRQGDLLARWGGEEFLVVMPNCSAAQTASALGRWRERLRKESFDDVAPGAAVSFSAGVAECSNAADLEAAIARADAAMYRAKHGGRDRIEISLPEAAAESLAV